MPELHDALDAEARRRRPRDQPPLSHLVGVHRRRQVRRRVLAAALLVGAAVGGGALLQSLHGEDRLEGAPASAAPSPEPSPAPSVAPSPEPSPTPSPATPAVPCRDQELMAVATGGGAVSNGSTGATLRVTNVGLAPCRLPARPASLATVDTPLPTEPAASDRGGPQTLPPGGVAAFEVSSVRAGGSGCSRPAPASASAPTRLVMTFDAEPTAVVAGLIGGGRFVLACWPVQVGRMHLPAAGSGPGPDALWPAEADAPAAGGCGSQPGSAVVVETNPDVPQPRCVTIRPDQRLRVRNTSNRFGEPGKPVVVWFAGYPPRTVEVGRDTVFDRPAGQYLLPGVHPLRLSLYRGAGNAEIWLQG